MENKLTLKKPKKIVSLLLIALFIGLTAFATVVLANQGTIKVDASVVNVRTGPGLSYDIMTQVTGGEKVTMLSEENEWYKVRLSNDQIGWIASWLIENTEVSAATNKMGIVTGQEVNIRTESNINSDILGKVTNGTELTVLFQQEGWTQVQYNGQVAWISSDLIEISETATETTTVAVAKDDSATIQTVTTRSAGTNIRNSASISSSVVETAEKGESFNYLSTEGDWYQVELPDGQTGYVANWVVDLSADQTPAPTASVTSLAEATIVIDAGHGGNDPGALANTFLEKEVTLSTAKLVANRLRDAGANVILTRSDDEFLSLDERTVISNQSNADVFISLHYDSTETANEISGTTTYYYHDKDIPLAEIISTNFQQNGILPNNDIRFGDFYVTRENTQAAILIELGYLNNDVDQLTVNSSTYQSSVSEIIYQSLNQYFIP
ncbi:N-acetylmuramoyl-L-alanine amidase [Carnobacterium pleistocenium]|uniref:N-acetylmuramoyl-L-alanine amidase n=1 Tax=Carnobacterium pleistocenium TaxID=181073 RepID=UPI0005558845|nr:N-acetylmuramoyl-L-alanine amidase [Carnobacterium pleistocenium]